MMELRTFFKLLIFFLVHFRFPDSRCRSCTPWRNGWGARLAQELAKALMENEASAEMLESAEKCLLSHQQADQEDPKETKHVG